MIKQPPNSETEYAHYVANTRLTEREIIYRLSSVDNYRLYAALELVCGCLALNSSELADGLLEKLQTLEYYLQVLLSSYKVSRTDNRGRGGVSTTQALLIKFRLHVHEVATAVKHDTVYRGPTNDASIRVKLRKLDRSLLNVEWVYGYTRAEVLVASKGGTNAATT